MQMAIDVAGFTPAEADELRRAMGSKRSARADGPAQASGSTTGMAGNGITGELADDIFVKIAAFANFGFPESHAISFAYLVYASAWFKRYHPAAFCAALLNAQPMGFYSTAVPGRRRPPARGGGAPARHQRQRRGGDAGADRRTPVVRATARASRRSGGGAAGRWSGWAWPRCAPSATSWPSASRPSAGAGGPYRDLRDLARRCRAAPLPRQPGGAGHRGRVRLLRAEPAGGAVGGRGRGAGARRPAAGHRRSGVRGADAARHGRGRSRWWPTSGRPGCRRTRTRSQFVREHARPAGRACRSTRSPTVAGSAPGSWSAGSSPTGSARRPPAGSPSSTWRTRPACSTWSARRGCGSATARWPGPARRCWCGAGWSKQDGVLNLIADHLATLRLPVRPAARDFR